MGTKKDVLVIGGGGREHAIVWKLSQSPMIGQIYAAPGNGGISLLAQCFNDIKATDIPGVVGLAKKLSVDLVAVIPDDPLAMGMVDALSKEGIRAFGPTATAAEIESSKVFSKGFMQRHNIPTAAHKVFESSESANEYLRSLSESDFPIVIKADGLAVGKGVIIARDMNESLQAVQTLMEDRIFGESGNRVVIEDFLQGPEVTVLAFCDGRSLFPMVSSMDHKRVFDGDLGLNTGGMGTVSPNPYYTQDIAIECMETIFKPTIEGLSKEGKAFKGCIYFGLMLTKKGPMVIEYNARFGDPETQVVLPLLKGDLLEIMEATIDGTLDKVNISYEDGYAVCVVLASGGYPGSYVTGLPIKGLTSLPNTALCFHAGTKRSDNDTFLTAGGRVLGIVAKSNTLSNAINDVYEASKTVDFDNMHYRKDIGSLALKAF